MKEKFSLEVDDKFLFEKAYEKMQRSKRINILKEEDFKDVYSLEEIENDLKNVEKIKNKYYHLQDETGFGLEQKRHSEIIEHIIIEESELEDWFGENAITFKTADHDDIHNKIDMIIEFEEAIEDTENAIKELAHLGLAIDISFSKDVDKKFAKIKDEIREGHLSKVKYFRSERAGAKPIENLPRVVILSSGKTLNDLAEKWLEGDKEGLGKHVFQLQMLEEISTQLKVYEEYARVVVKNEETAAIYKHYYQIVNKIRLERKKKFPDYDGAMYDESFDTMDNNLKLLFRDEIGVIAPKKSPAELYKEQQRRKAERDANKAA